jgi:hypothetical protein
MTGIVQDEYWSTQLTKKGVIRAFTMFLRRKYVPMAVEEVRHAHGGGRKEGFSDGLERTVGTALHTGEST